MLSFKALAVLCVIFRSMIHFELFFVKDIKSASRFMVLHMDMDAQAFQHHVFKRFVFSL